MTKEIIVIGAGMSGIIAAKTLIEAGFSVLVLEARPRIGGRTHTDHSLGTSVDLGAAWIHGPIGNPLTPLKEAFGVTGSQTDLGGRPDDVWRAFKEDGQALNMGDFETHIEKIQGDLKYQTHSVLSPSLPQGPLSVADVLNITIETAPSHSELDKLALNYGQRIRTALWEAADVEEVDWRLMSDYIELPGGDILLSGGGYNGITDRLAEGLSIQTETIIHAINYAGEQVEIESNRGRFVGDAAVVTLPLGVLKEEKINFTPALPLSKQEAIQRIGFGRAEKLILRFDQFYWPKEVEYFAYIPDDGSQYFSSWNNLGLDSGIPIIAVYITGSHAQIANQWSDGEMLEQGMTVLTKMFGEMPAPLDYVRTGWGSDPHAKGSYSFNRVGQRPGDRAELAQPLCKRLFFAGEATHPSFFGTVHGAYETGIRAAQEIITQWMN